jgi:hypothetical protein
VVVIHGTEMVLRCRDYRQAVRWTRLECKSYKIPEPDIDVAAKAESGDLPLSCVLIEIDLLGAKHWAEGKGK